MENSIRKPIYTNGYRMVYVPNHFHVYSSESRRGYAYEHRYVIEKQLGRPLLRDEVVHHKDGNKLNNNIENLEVLSLSEHAHKHKGIKPSGFCVDCGKFLPHIGESKRCQCCYHVYSRKVERPSKEVLAKMIEEKSWCAIGREFGVSDNAVRKWARGYGLI